MQGSLTNVLGLAGAVLAKAEQDSAASARDAKPCCAARVAMSKAVRLPSLLPIPAHLHSCTALHISGARTAFSCDKLSLLHAPHARCLYLCICSSELAQCSAEPAA